MALQIPYGFSVSQFLLIKVLSHQSSYHWFVDVPELLSTFLKLEIRRATLFTVVKQLLFPNTSVNEAVP